MAFGKLSGLLKKDKPPVKTTTITPPSPTEIAIPNPLELEKRSGGKDHQFDLSSAPVDLTIKTGPTQYEDTTKKVNNFAFDLFSKKISFDFQVTNKFLVQYLKKKERKRLEELEEERRWKEYKAIYISKKDVRLPGLKWYHYLSGVSNQDRLYMIEMVVEYLTAGLQLYEAYEMLSYKTKKKKLQVWYQYIKLKIEKGQSLDKIFEEFPSLIKSHQLYLIKIGVETGKLKESLLALRDDVLNAITNRKKINSIVLYPKIVFGFSLSILFGFILFGLPKIAEFVGGYEKLPPIAQVSYKGYTLMKDWWFIVIPTIIGLVVTHKMTLAKTHFWVKSIHQMVIDFPMFGILFRMINVKMIFFYFFLLEKSGKNMLDALDLIKKSLSNYSYFVYVDELEQFAKRDSLNLYQSMIELNKKKFGPQIQKSDTIYVLPDEALLDDRILTYIQTGMKTGSLTKQYERIVKQKTEDIDFFIANMKTYVELGSLILVAPVVMYIMLVVYMSLFSIYNSVG